MSIIDNTSNDSRLVSSQDPNDSIGKRLCWVCFGTDQDDEDINAVWISPCQCKGTMRWVHEECLQKWIDEKQKRINTLKVSCSQCKTQYLLSFPPVNYAIRLIDQYDKLLYGSSPFVAVTVVVGSIYWCFASFGFISIIQIMGYEDGRRLVDESDPLLLVIGLPVIPIALILSKLIKWEDFILRLWKLSAFKLPSPLSFIIEQPPIRPRANCDQILVDPGFNEPLGCTRMICGALILPTVSALVGKIFFSHISGSPWRRSLVGGLAFLLVKGIIKIYYRKSQYIRYSQRSIKNYIPNKTSTEQGSSGASTDRGNFSSDEHRDNDRQQLSPVMGELSRNISRDDSDDELQPTGATFSMTIRF